MGTQGSSKPVTALVIGAGNRGSNYAAYAGSYPDRLKMVGVADPRAFYRDKMAKQYNIEKENVFQSWEEAASRPKFADCVFVCTPDKLHAAPTLAFAEKGYHILLEKPMAVTYDDCKAIVEACQKNNRILAVCHVLRYMPQSRKIKELIQAKEIGDVVNIQLLEPIGNWHFAHSYVRGNWRNSESSTFSLLAKSCHDIDLLMSWMAPLKCASLSSFGSLKHFTHKNKPAGASDRCMDCAVEKDCPYSAKKIYLDRVKMGHTGWPVKVITEVPDIESVTEALKTGPYGRCVYDCDNNVVDNQVVNFQFEGGETATFSMVAFTEQICARQVRIFGTKGELTCDFDKNVVLQFDFNSQQRITHDLTKDINIGSQSRIGGHGGADFFAMEAFVDAVQTGDHSKVLTGPEDTLMSHMIVFAAEKARLENRVVNLTEAGLKL